MALPTNCSVSELLKIAELHDRIVAVEVNLNIVPKQDHSSHRLQPGDRVEVVALVGGG